MKNKKIIAMLMFVIVLLAGCAELIEGNVVDKSHKDAYNYTTFVRVGKVMVPQTHRNPERWYLEVYSEEHEKNKSISVPEKDYLETEIGDFYSNEHLLPDDVKNKGE